MLGMERIDSVYKCHDGQEIFIWLNYLRSANRSESPWNNIFPADKILF